MQVALVPQMMSATVLLFPPLQIAGPALVAGPQSLSVRRMRAFTSTAIAWLKSMITLSPKSRVFAKPADAVSTADVESGPATPPGASMSRSGEPGRFHWLPLRSVIPELSVTTTGS